MKNYILIIVFALLPLSSFAQKVSFKADIDQMTPMGFPSQSGLSGYSLEVKGTTVDVYMPYMGEIHGSAPYGGGDGLNFKEKCTELKVANHKKKGEKEISFTTRHEGISYKFNVTIYDNSTIYVNVQPSNGQSCTYSGQVMEQSK